MECEELEVLISAYVDGELDEDELRIVEEHLANCKECGDVLADFSLVHSLYGELEELQAPIGFRERVAQRIETPSRLSAIGAWTFFGLRYVFSVALLLLLVGAAVFLTMREAGMPQTEETLLAGDIDVFAEEILFGEGLLDEVEAFSTEDNAVADEIMDEFFSGVEDTSGVFENAELTT